MELKVILSPRLREKKGLILTEIRGLHLKMINSEEFCQQLECWNPGVPWFLWPRRWIRHENSTWPLCPPQGSHTEPLKRSNQQFWGAEGWCRGHSLWAMPKPELLVHLNYLWFWWMQTLSSTSCEEPAARGGSAELTSGRRRFMAAPQHIWKKIIAADALQKGNICVHQWLNCFLLYHIP